jgi:phosphatidylglycerophosphate synthase
MPVSSTTNRDDLTQLALSATFNVALGLILVLTLALLTRSALELRQEFVAQATFSFAAIGLMLSFMLHQHLPRRTLGPANQVTLTRAVFVALLVGMIGSTPTSSSYGWFVAALVTLNLVLDGVDGWFARRSGMVSPFGARFDMEIDALLILVLAILVCQADRAGPWVLLVGGWRYIFIAAGWLLPALRNPLPPSRRRQTVCVLQTAGLAICLTPITPLWGAQLVAGVTLSLLTLSFSQDIYWLLRHPSGGTASG